MTTAYFQSVEISALSLNKQNYDATAADFLPFDLSGYSDNAGSEADEVSVRFPLGTLSQTDIESLITKGSQVVITGHRLNLLAAERSCLGWCRLEF